MTTPPSILSITGSDSTGVAGILADIRTVAAMGGNAVSAISTITAKDCNGTLLIHDVEPGIVVDQVRTALNEFHPNALKIGMLRDVQAIKAVRNEVIRCSNIILAPGVTTSSGERIMTDESVRAWKRYLLPEATVLFMKCKDAEVFLGMSVSTEEDMLLAARTLHECGVKNVFLRGGQIYDGLLTALFYNDDGYRFVSSCNTEGWQRHGVGGALSTAVATRLAMGDEITAAFESAHKFMHSQVVYAVSTNDEYRLRSADIYNQFMSLVADNYTTAHDVSFYADRLCISSRYLSGITDKVMGRSPKQLITDFLNNQAEVLLETTRLTIQEISDRLGFANQAAFAKTFKQKNGITPTEYRNSL